MIPRNEEVRFEVTTKCNYSCIICPRDKLTRPKVTMSLALFKKLLDKITAETPQYRVLTLPGMGEPLLDPTLEEKIEYARSKNLNVLLLSNGSLLTVRKFKALESCGVESIRVSFYGTDPNTYAKIHGRKFWAFFLKIRESLTKISKIKKSTQLLLTLNVLAGINDYSVKPWVEYWKDKADLLEVWRPHNWADGRSYRHIQEKQLKTCGRPWNTPLQVQVDGTVNMCCFDFDGKLTLGDLKKQSLKEIFSSPMYKKIIACHASGNFKNSGLICDSCDQRNIDKSDVMLYNSKFDIKDRVKVLSTTYRKVIPK